MKIEDVAVYLGHNFKVPGVAEPVPCFAVVLEQKTEDIDVKFEQGELNEKIAQDSNLLEHKRYIPDRG